MASFKGTKDEASEATKEEPTEKKAAAPFSASVSTNVYTFFQ